MTDTEVIKILRKHVEGLFPKECPNCHRRFLTLRDYILETKPVGDIISYDAEVGDWKPFAPMGSAAMSNCTCGSTLTLTTDGLSIVTMWRLLHWARVETKRRNKTFQQLLDDVRDEIRKQVLAEPKPGGGSGNQDVR